MGATVRGQPPGRAGLMWLARRDAVATRGADLLERKLRILLAEEKDYALLEERTRAEWGRAVGELDVWMLRSALVSGQRAVRLAGDGASCQVEVTWQLTMGVRYPTSATCTIREPPASGFTPDNSALREAVPVAQRAIRAGVDHAVASAAHAAVVAEIAATRRQLRALRERWIPRLEMAHRSLLVTLDDQEHDEHVRLRWAADPTRSERVRP